MQPSPEKPALRTSRSLTLSRSLRMAPDSLLSLSAGRQPAGRLCKANFWLSAEGERSLFTLSAKGCSGCWHPALTAFPTTLLSAPIKQAQTAHLLAWAPVPAALLGADDLAFMYLTRPRQACSTALTAVTAVQVRLNVACGCRTGERMLQCSRRMGTPARRAR